MSSLDTSHLIFDTLKRKSIERLRLRSHDRGFRILATNPEGVFEDAAPMIPELEPTLEILRAAMEAGGHERLDFVYRAEIDLRFLCAVHSSQAGPPSGGLKRVDLVVPELDLIPDLLNLARAMTLKNRVAGIARGGSKLLVHGVPFPERERIPAIAGLAEEIGLSGTLTGPDTGFSLTVLQALAEAGAPVTGLRAATTGGSAAVGVHRALHATAASLGLPISETKIVVQGLGSLGLPLANALSNDGAALVVTDRDHRRIDGFLGSLSPEARAKVGVVAPYQATEVQADILAPCAIGGVISEDTIPRLKVRAICGGANNQLAAPSLEGELRLARLLHARAIVFVPDWVASVGGTIHGEIEHQDQDRFDEKKVRARILRVCGWELDEILDTSRHTGRPPMEVAIERYQLPLRRFPPQGASL